MRFRHFLAAVAFLLSFLPPAVAQFVEGDPGGAKLGQSQTKKWRCGMVVTAVGGACKGIVGYAPVPIEWPEQQVKVLEEDVSPGVKITYQVVDGTAKVMTVKIPHLEAGREARAVVTFEIQRSVMLPPEDTDAFLLPELSKLDRTVRPFLTPSPKIESTNAKIRELAKKIGGDKSQGVGPGRGDLRLGPRERQVSERTAQGRPGGFEGRHGRLRGIDLAVHCHLPRGRHSRPHRVGARPLLSRVLSWDEKGDGHWFPCQIAGARQFGGMPETKPILQKGDNFRSPANPRDRQRYLAE